jgi:pyruvate dehydrogenase E2 component (dihydrolipoamide acetyltransferase)
MAMKEIKIPDLEGSENVGVVEIYVQTGEKVDVETPLISLESDKAVMDVPSPIAGTIKEWKISEGDTVNTGDIIAVAEVDEEEQEATDKMQPPEQKSDTPESETADPGDEHFKQEIRVPDLEGSTDVAVVEVYVSPGEHIDEDTPLISLESDKAVMDVPSPASGTILEVMVKEGDTVNTDDLIMIAEGKKTKETSPQKADDEPSKPAAPQQSESAEKASSKKPSSVKAAPVNAQAMGGRYHATPSVRSFARELGVELSRVTGSGPKGRITREDVSGLVKSVMSGSEDAVPQDSRGFTLPPIPTEDFSLYGEIETESLSRIKRISGPHLHRNWVGVPHVTQFEDADITDLEAFRKQVNVENAKSGGPKVSPLIFVIQAAVQALRAFPDFNSSLAPDGSSLIRKKYYHIGIAVDTPGGLVVPVIKNADAKGVFALSEELMDLSFRAREGKLKADEMKGATFSISSLGGIGGTYFTPIVNAPEVAILGLSKSAMKPVWNGEEFKPRLVLPFSVSYDHRVIDGAQGARFAAYLSGLLSDMRRALL